jgi:hypothetical protein
MNQQPAVWLKLQLHGFECSVAILSGAVIVIRVMMLKIS